MVTFPNGSSFPFGADPVNPSLAVNLGGSSTRDSLDKSIFTMTPAEVSAGCLKKASRSEPAYDGSQLTAAIVNTLAALAGTDAETVPFCVPKVSVEYALRLTGSKSIGVELANSSETAGLSGGKSKTSNYVGKIVVNYAIDNPKKLRLTCNKKSR